MAGKRNPNLWNILIPVGDIADKAGIPTGRKKILYEPDMNSGHMEKSSLAKDVLRSEKASSPQPSQSFGSGSYVKKETSIPGNNAPSGSSVKEDLGRQTISLTTSKKSNTGALVTTGIIVLLISVLLWKRNQKMKEQENLLKKEKAEKERATKLNGTITDHKIPGPKKSNFDEFLDSEIGKNIRVVLEFVLWILIATIVVVVIKGLFKAVKKFNQEFSA
jgi:hypothetical protein